MSFRRGSQFQQPPLRSPQNQQPPGAGQNGGFSGQYGQPQYPGQTSYDPYSAGGGPVQHQQGGYVQASPASPRQPSYGAQYPGQQQYQYNPQHFAQPQQQAQPISYNPQNYVNPSQGGYGQQYTPQTYVPTSPASQSHAAGGMSATSGPVDTYGFSQARYGTHAYSYAQPSTGPAGQQYSPHMPPHAYSYPSPVNPAPPTPDRYGATQGPPYPAEHYSQAAQGLAITSTTGLYGPTMSPGNAATSDNWRPSPPAYDANDSWQSPSAHHQSDSYGSLPSPPSPGPTPPAHAAPARSNTLDRHPQSRPLPGPPDRDGSGYFRGSGHRQLSREEEEALSQEELFQQVESAVMGGRSSGVPSSNNPVSQPSYGGNRTSSASFATNSFHVQRNASTVNGYLSPAPTDAQYGSDSDVEASQGVAMMRMADDEEEAIRRQSGASLAQRFSGAHGSQRSSRQQQYTPTAEGSDSDDYGTFDVSTYGGGFDVGRLSYGGDPGVLAARGDESLIGAYNDPVSSQHSSMRRSHASHSSQASRGEYEYVPDSIHPFPPFNAAARVDAGGTGGLSEPNADGRRQSYDEGDEAFFLDPGTLPDRFPDEPPDIFYQPASTSYRPLPNLPEGEAPPYVQSDLRRTPSSTPYPVGPEGLFINQNGQWVPRSTSLISHASTPQIQQPLRSKTDAEERRSRLQQLRGPALSNIDSAPGSALAPEIDLPTLPGKRFVPAQLGAPAFKKCIEPWSLGSLLKWLLQVTNPEQITEIREQEVKEALVALFTNKVPTMNIADAETLSNRVVLDMYSENALVTMEEWVKIVPVPMQGVIFQLTASGCYSPTLHDHVIPGRCYAHHCQRTLKKVNLHAQPVRSSESWAEFYKLKKEDIEGKDKKDLDRQYMLHEIVQTEDMYMEQINVLRTVYRDTLTADEPSIISPKRRDKFIKDVFGKLEAIKQANEDHLLPQLKYRQQEQGPWIVGFSDIFRQWIRKAKAAYIEYAGAFPGATFTVRQELDRNIDFRSFIDRARNDKRSMKLGWDTFLKAPITRLQRYTLLLSTVLKTMQDDSEEKSNLIVAYDEVKAVTLECDTRVAEMQRKCDLTDLAHKLVLRPGMQNAVELNLDHFGRELIHRGDLQRMGGNRFTWLDSHALLFDHYLVLAKTVATRAEQGGKLEKYDVSRLPIPMDLLILESFNDPPVQKSSYMKGITSVRDVTGRTSTPEQAGLGKVPSNQPQGGAQMQQSNTGASGASLQPVTSLSESKDADRIMYPFKVRHLGREVYTLFAPTEQARKDWCAKIIEAKRKHAAALYNQNAEPFKLRVIADAAFVFDAYGVTGGKGVVIKGTPVDRAIKEVEQRFKDTGRPGPTCRARVNCATSFSTAFSGKQMVAVGTDYGIYITETDNPRGWAKATHSTRVTQIAVLEEFNTFLLISDKSLIAYPLDVICSGLTSTTPANDSIAKAPKKLSGSRDVGFFVVGRMKDRMLVFYKKRENMASVFKVLEPVYQKSSEKKRGMFKRGNADFFRDYDEFYVPAECNGINLFHSSVGVSTSKGIEVMTLDKKQPTTVPDLSPPHVQNIATHIKDQKSLAMLRLSDQEFLLVYSNCAVYVNKHGEVSRSVIMEFVGNAQAVALYGAYLLLFDHDFVEIRNAQNGRLKQIIAGREIKCLDDGGSWSSAAPPGVNGNANGPLSSGRTVKMVMQHPEFTTTQIIVELLLNENMKE